MELQNHGPSRAVIHRRLKVLMAARVLIVSLLLGASALIQAGSENTPIITPSSSLYLLIGLTYTLTIIYALVLRRTRNVYRFAYAQILFDTVFVTALVYLTGGIESLFPLAYIFSITSAGLLLSKRGTYMIAGVSGALYSATLGLQYYGLIRPSAGSGFFFYTGQDVFYRVFLYLLAFAVVAALVNHLGEELRLKGRELKQKQLDYEKLEAFHQNIIESLDSGLITTDRSGKVSFLNRTAYRILGIDRFSQVSSYLDDLLAVCPSTASGESTGWEKTARREEIGFKRPDGKYIHLGLSRSSLRDINGAVVGSILIFQDITRIKEMEEQIKRTDRMVSIGQMAAGLAHEIRNPLASMTGSIQVLKEDINLTEENVNLMNIVIRESERLNRLVTDFLLFAQPPRSELVPIILNHLVDETLQMLKNSPKFNGHISVSRVFSHQVRVLGDSNQLKQVFWNLLLNAVQEMKDGGLLLVKLEKEDGSAKLSVSDTGKGIERENLGKIFEPFFTTKESGTGLGLAIVHRIVETHGGRIRVKSEVGKGTTFSVFFPEIGRS
ncbi:MAG: PAS domain S-box protein [Deltaproteobacteria bacterium]|nr:PAS domain S-box protein [Deltaproteobacteria bacterium]